MFSKGGTQMQPASLAAAQLPIASAVELDALCSLFPCASFPAPQALDMPKVALLFLTKGDLFHSSVWERWFQAGGCRINLQCNF